MNAIRIRENLQLETAYLWPNPPSPKAKVPGWVKAEREQQRLDNDRRACFNRLVWSMWTSGKS